MVKVKHARTADCVVAGFRWHKQGPGDARRLAAARPLRRRGRAAPRRRDVVVHDGGAPPAGGGAGAAARGRARGASLARLGRAGRRRRDAHARRPEPLERGQGPVVGAAAHRARVRGEVRPPAGRPLPARGDLPALAARQAARGLPLRPARGHSRRPSWPRSSAAGTDLGRAIGRGAAPRVVVGIERLLRRPERLRHVLEVHADAGPGRGAPAHRVDQHVGGLRGARPPRDGAPSSARARRARPPSSRRGRSRGAASSDTRRPPARSLALRSATAATRGGSPACLA